MRSYGNGTGDCTCGEVVAMQIIKLIDSNDFVMTVTLDNESYRLKFGWNDYQKQWSMDIRDSRNNDIVRGIALVPNFPLLDRHKRSNVPLGELMCTFCKDDDTTQTIGRRDFVDGRCNLVYIPESELNAIKELV